MARLSSAESVLKKLSDVDQKLEELYETVDLIKSLHDNLKRVDEKSKEYEVQLEEKLEEIGKLEKAHGEGIKELKDIAESSEEELEKISSEFDEEKTKIREALQPLISKKLDLEKMRRELDDAMSRVDHDIKQKVTHFSTQLETVINDSKNKITQVCEEGKNLIAEELNHLLLLKDSLIQDIDNFKNELRDDLSALKNTIESDLKRKTDDLFKKQDVFQQKANQNVDFKIFEETEKLRISTEKKIDEFLGRQKNLIDNLTQRIDSFEGLVSDQKAEQSKIEENLKQIISVITNYKKHIIKLDERILQIEQTTVSDLERRIGTIENTLEEMQKKRRLWPFSK